MVIKRIKKLTEHTDILDNNMSYNDWFHTNIEDFDKLFLNKNNESNLYEHFMNWKFIDSHKYHISHPRKFKNYQDKLYESLTISYDIRKFADKLLREFNDQQLIHIQLDAYHNETLLYAYITDNNIHNKLQKLCDFYGYTISTYNFDKTQQCYIYVIESNHSVEDVTDIVKNEANNIVYHITNKNYFNKIKKYGLYPQHKNKKTKHPDRIYLTLNLDDKQLIDELYPDGNYLILEIDLNKNSYPIRLFVDDAYDEYGCFTKDHISPKAITIYQITI